MTDSETLTAIAATEIERLHRMSHLGEMGTAGPDSDPTAADIAPPPHPAWIDGWWQDARRCPAHPGRVGGPISPFAIGIHTCDMLPSERDALERNWTTKAGEGACAHFLITETEVIQFVSIARNANHMGGPGHGVFVVAGHEIHPNLVTVGIEIHNAGGVRRVAGQWRLVECGVAHGPALPDADVIQDPTRTDRGWHRVTPYQYDRLTALLADLEPVLAPLPAGTTTKAFGEVPAPFAVMPTARIVTHAQMDPVHRADPWKPVCDWLRRR